MTFDFQTEKEKSVSWYAEMASNLATVDQARHSVKVLQDRFPHDFGDLGQLVAQRMKEQQSDPVHRD